MTFWLLQENSRKVGLLMEPVQNLDLVARYSAGECMAKCAIHQLAGYHYNYKCKLGLISTYTYNWVTWMDNDGTLFISPAFCSTTSGIDSTLNQLYFVICLAVNQLGDGSILWNPPYLKIPADAEDSEMQSNTEGLRGGDGFRFIRCMVKHEDRITWQCRYDASDSLIAVKAFKEQDDRDREAVCYDALKTLQGVEIPILLDGGCELADQKYKYGLIFSWVGSEYGGNYMFLPKSALLQAQGIVASMHANSIVHRDLRPENMNYNFTTGRLFLFDFSHAVTKNSIGAEAFEHARKGDLCVLQELIHRSETPQAAKAVEWSASWARRMESSGPTATV